MEINLPPNQQLSVKVKDSQIKVGESFDIVGAWVDYKGVTLAAYIQHNAPVVSIYADGTKASLVIVEGQLQLQLNGNQIVPMEQIYGLLSARWVD